MTANPGLQTIALHNDLAQLCRVSSPGEFHPEALSEPYVNVSIHTAPIIQPR